jgi:hypothetical protein
VFCSGIYKELKRLKFCVDVFYGGEYSMKKCLKIVRGGIE